MTRKAMRRALLAALGAAALYVLYVVTRTPFPADTTPEGAYLRLAQAITERHVQSAFPYTETETQWASFTIRNARRDALALADKSYPPAELAKLRESYGALAKAPDGPDAFALLMEERGYRARLAKDMSGVDHVETEGERAALHDRLREDDDHLTGAGGGRDGHLQLPFFAWLLDLLQPAQLRLDGLDARCGMRGRFHAGTTGELVAVGGFALGANGSADGLLALLLGLVHEPRAFVVVLLEGVPCLLLGDGAVVQKGVPATVVELRGAQGTVDVEDRRDGAGQELAVV